MTREPRWRIGDLIDFEYFIREDSKPRPSSSELHQRDRRIYQNLGFGVSAPHDRDLLRLWVEERRRQLRNPGDDPSADEQHVRTPGEWFESYYHLASLLTIVLGAVAGAGFMRAFCYYDGTTPINVVTFVMWFVGVQYALFVGLFFLKFTPRRVVEPSRAVVQRAVLWLFEAIVSTAARWSNGVHSERRWRAGIGDLRRKAAVYGDVWYWPIASLVQAFMLSFNLGAWGWLLVGVAGEDLAFAWQSSLISGADHVHMAVHTLSAPWAWLGAEVRPTLEEVRTSQFLKARGIGNLPDASMKAWIPLSSAWSPPTGSAFVCWSLPLLDSCSSAAPLVACASITRKRGAFWTA